MIPLDLQNPFDIFWWMIYYRKKEDRWTVCPWHTSNISHLRCDHLKFGLRRLPKSWYDWKMDWKASKDLLDYLLHFEWLRFWSLCHHWKLQWLQHHQMLWELQHFEYVENGKVNRLLNLEDLILRSLKSLIRIWKIELMNKPPQDEDLQLSKRSIYYIQMRNPKIYVLLHTSQKIFDHLQAQQNQQNLLQFKPQTCFSAPYYKFVAMESIKVPITIKRRS